MKKNKLTPQYQYKPGQVIHCITKHGVHGPLLILKTDDSCLGIEYETIDCEGNTTFVYGIAKTTAVDFNAFKNKFQKYLSNLREKAHKYDKIKEAHSLLSNIIQGD